MFGVGPSELILIFMVILLLFGAKRIPEIAHGLGKGINEFKKAAREITNEIDSASLSTAQEKTVKMDGKEKTV